MDSVQLMQLAYLGLSAGATVFVGRTLFKHGRIFLVDAFAGNTALAEAVNHLLVVGFYLINIGYVSGSAERYELQSDDPIGRVGARLGTVLLVLGGMHFFNLFVFSRIRRRGLLHRAPPPVAPTQVIAPARVA